MSIQTEQELEGLREAGRIVREALDAMRDATVPGITTAELNEIGGKVLERNGARSAPMVHYGFPAAICISVNEEIVHGVPSEKVVRPGDLVKLDVVAEKEGFMADTAITVAVPPVTDRNRRLVACAERAFHEAMTVARPGRRVNEIGRVVERVVRGSGFSVVRELCGHGVGRAIHEDPEVPNFHDRYNRERLSEGLVITVEPMITAGSGRSAQLADGWTIVTADGSLAAHFEHTIVISKGPPLLLTA